MPSGKPLNPYLIGLLVDYLRKEVRPKDLKVVPDDLFQQPGMKDFLEWSLLRSWMRLRLVHWYASVALRPDVSVEELLETAPYYPLGQRAEK
ncbi:UNVERIFIED_CONTAM: hypothetical protein Sradi_6882600 [Sesamum radiatum]|uniref:Uncharacterized protein n=1 Tax=Sesamum radiatum TaxID=300843 RepID=A0AAW2JLP9_SESRA